MARPHVSSFPLFSDQAVLQASEHVPVWGRATPSVTITHGDQATAAALTSADGKWTATLDLSHVGSELYEPAARPTVRSSPGGSLEGFVLCGEDHR